MPCLPAGLQACQLALSTRTVWARCPNGDLARRYGVTDKRPAGDYWKKVPGNVTCFTGRCRARGCTVLPGLPGRLAGFPKRLLPTGARLRATPEVGFPATGLNQSLPGRGQGTGPPALKLGKWRHVQGPPPETQKVPSGRGPGLLTACGPHPWLSD